jgi:CRISPR-associated endonuclease/helicase Cas3
MNNNVCDVSFLISPCTRNQNNRIQLDHGYVLYSALSNILPELHETDGCGIFPMNGKKIGNNYLLLTKSSNVRIRLPLEFLPKVVTLNNKIIKIGDQGFYLHEPTLHMLTPYSKLYARKVYIHLAHTPTIDDGKINFDSFKEEFTKSLNKQLNELNVTCKAHVLGRQRVSVKDNVVLTFSVMLEDLSVEDSIKIQSLGLGGKRKMGCGIFRCNHKGA